MGLLRLNYGYELCYLNYSYLNYSYELCKRSLGFLAR